MKYLKYLFLSFVFILSSCYIYKPYTGEDFDEPVSRRSATPGKPSSFRDGAGGKTDRHGLPMLSKDEGDLSSQKAKQQEEDKRKRQEEGDSGQNEEMKKKEDERRKVEDEKRKLEAIANMDIGDEEKKKMLESQSLNQGPTDAEIEEAKKKADSEEEDVDIKEKLKPKRHYKLTVEEKKYKVQVVKWEADTLISHVIRKPEKELKFHKDQIDNEEVLERRFSKPFSDLITVGSYVTVGAAILLLLL